MGQIRVLCIDDEEDLVSAWIERLSLRDIAAEGATNGNDALNRIKDKNFDVVVLDIRMPGIDGHEIMKHLKVEKPDLPVILITGHECPDEKDKALRASSFDCLVKPVDIEVLINRIKTAVKSYG